MTFVASDYIPKPDRAPYEEMMQRHGIDPARAFFAEDSAHNLEPAAAMGITTFLVRGRYGWPEEVEDMNFVHHRADLLTPWLSALTRG